LAIGGWLSGGRRRRKKIGVLKEHPNKIESPGEGEILIT